MAKLSLNIFLAKESYTEFDSVVEKDSVVRSIPLRESLGFEGVIYVGKNPKYVPKWFEWLKNATDGDLKDVVNRSTRAVLLVRTQGRIFAFPFGHGRHMLVQEVLVRDFGILVALNGVDPDSLWVVDTVTITDIILHQKTQASRRASIDTFKPDDLSSLLHKLTGTPKDPEYGYKLTGRESISFSKG